jgi:hypothetical protein
LANVIRLDRAGCYVKPDFGMELGRVRWRFSRAVTSPISATLEL